MAEKDKNTETHVTLDDFEAQYLREHPDEIDSYIETVFETYAETGNSGALLRSLRNVAQVKGMARLAEEVGLTRSGFYKALSTRGNPRLDNMNAIMNAFGYQLMPQKISDRMSL